MTNSESAELPKLKSAIEKTCLNDRSVSVALDSSLAMGSGWRLGFLGVLHMEVFQQRMSQEFDAEVIVTAPTVPYKITVLAIHTFYHQDHLLGKQTWKLYQSFISGKGEQSARIR